MNTKTTALMVSGLVVMLGAMTMIAVDAAPAAAGKVRVRPAGEQGKAEMSPLERLHERFAACKPPLSDEQKTKIKELVKAAREKAKDLEGQEKREVYAQVLKDVAQNVLTAEQRESMRQGGPFEACKPPLTDEQKAKIKELVQSAREKAKDLEGPEKLAALEQLRKDITQNVLTEEQRASLPKRGEGRPGKGDGQKPQEGGEPPVE